MSKNTTEKGERGERANRLREIFANNIEIRCLYPNSIEKT